MCVRSCPFFRAPQHPSKKIAGRATSAHRHLRMYARRSSRATRIFSINLLCREAKQTAGEWMAARNKPDRRARTHEPGAKRFPAIETRSSWRGQRSARILASPDGQARPGMKFIRTTASTPTIESKERTDKGRTVGLEDGWKLTARRDTGRSRTIASEAAKAKPPGMARPIGQPARDNLRVFGVAGELREIDHGPAWLRQRGRPRVSSRQPAAARDVSASSPPFRGTPAPCSSAAARSLPRRPT